MSTEQLAIACPASDCNGLLHTKWHRGKPRYAPCTACTGEFKMCTRGENCCSELGPVQRLGAFHRNGGNLRASCKDCQRNELRYCILHNARVLNSARFSADCLDGCRLHRALPCPGKYCAGKLVQSTDSPLGVMTCFVCEKRFMSCTSGDSCCSGQGCIQSADAFAVQPGTRKRMRCTHCTQAAAAQAQPCLGTLSAACSTGGSCTAPAATCPACAAAYSKELAAAIAFLRSCLLTELADGGQKLDFVQFAAPMRPIAADGKNIFPRKDVSLIFGMQTPQTIRSTIAKLQQKFEEAGGRVRDAVAGTKGKFKPAAPGRMFWEAPAPNVAACSARPTGTDAWTKGVQGCYYLQRLYVVKLTDSMAFNYAQHRSSLQRVFSKPENYIMQAPRESYNDSFGGFHYKFVSIYQIAKSYASGKPVGSMMHDGQLQRCFSLKACPTDEALRRVLRKQ